MHLAPSWGSQDKQGDLEHAGHSVVSLIFRKEFDLSLNLPSFLLFNHSLYPDDEHDVSHSAGAANAVCQERGHKFCLDCQAIFLLR